MTAGLAWLLQAALWSAGGVLLTLLDSPVLAAFACGGAFVALLEYFIDRDWPTKR